jgi:hypothetical protein
MTDEKLDDSQSAAVAALSVSHRRTFDALFRHPLAHNLEWKDVVALIGKLGEVREPSGNEFLFELGGHHIVLQKPHHKDLTADELLAIRRFVMNAGVPSPVTVPPLQATASELLIVVDHHDAKILHIDAAADAASDPVIRPYDPHHFLHHLQHKDQSRERGQRAPEEPAYYEEIAAAVAVGGPITVVGHGTGHSNAAHQLVEYLKTHHPETYRRIIGEKVADLSAVTDAQLIELARHSP